MEVLGAACGEHDSFAGRILSRNDLAGGVSMEDTFHSARSRETTPETEVADSSPAPLLASWTAARAPGAHRSSATPSVRSFGGTPFFTPQSRLAESENFDALMASSGGKKGWDSLGKGWNAFLTPHAQRSLQRAGGSTSISKRVFASPLTENGVEPRATALPSLPSPSAQQEEPMPTPDASAPQPEQACTRSQVGGLNIPRAPTHDEPLQSDSPQRAPPAEFSPRAVPTFSPHPPPFPPPQHVLERLAPPGACAAGQQTSMTAVETALPRSGSGSENVL